MAVSNNFQDDLSEEKRCINYLKSGTFFYSLFDKVYPDGKVITVDVKEGNFKFYDIELKFAHPVDGDFSETIEIKLDKACVEWGNALIEYEARKQPSGISTTTSSYWLHILFSKAEPGKVKFGLIPTQVLKDIIADGLKSSPRWFGTNKNCGDWDRAFGGKVGRGHAINEAVFFSKCSVVGYLDADNFVKGANIKPYDPSKYKPNNAKKRNFAW